MQLYCNLASGTPSQPQTLPTEWQGTANFHCLPPDELAARGWLPYFESAQPPFNVLIQKLELQLQQAGNQVNGVWQVVALTPQEMQATANGLISQYYLSLGMHYNEVAIAMGYLGGMLELNTYCGSKRPDWDVDCVKFFEWRDSCDGVAEDIMNRVKAGMKLPTIPEFIALMPAFTGA